LIVFESSTSSAFFYSFGATTTLKISIALMGTSSTLAAATEGVRADTCTMGDRDGNGRRNL